MEYMLIDLFTIHIYNKNLSTHAQRNYADAQKMAAVTATHLRPIFNAGYLKTAHGKHENKRRFLHQLETCGKNFIKLSKQHYFKEHNFI